jgi:hypothetical protein
MSELLEELRAERAAIEERAEIARLKVELDDLKWAAEQGRLVMEAVSEPVFVDPREHLYDDPTFGNGRYGTMFSRLEDRLDGKYLPIYETEQDLAMIRAQGRALAECFISGQNIIRNLNNYTIADGFTVEAKQKTRDCPRELVEAVQKVIDQFIEDNDWKADLETECHGRSREDGECALSLRPNGWRTKAQILEPDQILQPSNAWQLDQWLGCHDQFVSSWSFGVHTRARDTSDALGYHVIHNTSGTDWEYMPAGNVRLAMRLRTGCLELIKRNVPRSAKRGFTDFFPGIKHLQQTERCLLNTEKGGALQASIAFIRQHMPAATNDQIAQMRAAAATGSYTKQLGAMGSRTQYQQKFEGGTIIDTNGTEYKYGPLGQSSAPNFIEIVQAGFRYAGSLWAMPEYMISADASNNNFASILVSGSPFVQARASDQRFYGSRFRRVFWLAVRIAFEAGFFQKFGIRFFEQLEQMVEILLTPPDITIADELKDAQVKALEHAHGALSAETWTKESGRDVATEQANLAKEAQQQTMMGGGMMGGAGPDGIGGDYGGGGFGPHGRRPQPGQGGGGAAGGEYMGTTRLQQKRLFSTIGEVLQKVAAGEIRSSMAAEYLGALGLGPERIQRLLADIQDDGKLTPENAAALAEDAALMAIGTLLMEDCGTGNGGFKPGNNCATEDGGGSSIAGSGGGASDGISKAAGLIKAAGKKLPKLEDVEAHLGDTVSIEDYETLLTKIGLDPIAAAEDAYERRKKSGDNIATKSVVIHARHLLHVADREGRGADVIKEAGDAKGVELTSEDGTRKLLIHPSPRKNETGKWQLTRVDDKGPFGHQIFDTRDEALQAAVGAHPNGAYYDEGDSGYKITAKSGSGKRIAESYSGDCDWLSVPLFEDCGILELIGGDNCGTGAGGFQPGNKCAEEDGISSESGGTDRGQAREKPGTIGTQTQQKATGQGTPRKLIDKLKTDGGFTYNVVHENSPTKGFVVSTSLENERIFKADEITEEAVQKYLDERAKIFEAQPDAHVGGWYNEKTGEFYLDVSRVIDTEAEAVELAKKHNQEAIYDIAGGKSIFVNQGDALRKAGGSGATEAVRLSTGDAGESDRGKNEGDGKAKSEPPGRIEHPKSADDVDRYIAEVKKHPHFKQIEERLATLSKEAPEAGVAFWSKAKHSDAAGNYTPERKAVHERIIGALLNPKAATKEGERPLAVLTLGPPGAGKTTVMNREAVNFKGREFTAINPDDVKEKLPGYEGWNAGALHEESTDVANRFLMPKALEARHNIIYDSTGTRYDKMSRIVEGFEKAGYDVYLINVELPAHKAVGRAWDRFEHNAFGEVDESRPPGRYVPLEYVTHIGSKPATTFAKLKELPGVQGWLAVSTDVEPGKPHKELERGSR